MRVFDFVFICEDVRRTQEEWFETLVCLLFFVCCKRKFKSIKLNMCNKLLANFTSALLKNKVGV